MWWCGAAESGVADVQFNMGLCDRRGEGVEGVEREARSGSRASCGHTLPRRAVALAALLRLHPSLIATAPSSDSSFGRRVRARPGREGQRVDGRRWPRVRSSSLRPPPSPLAVTPAHLPQAVPVVKTYFPRPLSLSPCKNANTTEGG